MIPCLPPFVKHFFCETGRPPVSAPEETRKTAPGAFRRAYPAPPSHRLSQTKNHWEVRL